MPNKNNAELAALQRKVLVNELTLRTLMSQASLSEKHDINDACGYPTIIGIEDYKYMYNRTGWGNRIVSIYPVHTWRDRPQVFEDDDPKVSTDFEKAWKDLEDDESLKLYYTLRRADTLAGIGRFGILYLGFDDGARPETPITKKGSKLKYLRAFDESLVTIVKTEQNPLNPRFGQPTEYELNFSSEAGTTISTQRIKVHHTRVIHIAEESDDNVYGIPRLQVVYDNLLDIRKIAGGSAEMFWKGGFPGTLFNMDANAEVTEASLTQMKEQIANYANGLDRYIRMQGVSAQQLYPNVVSPSDHLKAQYEIISTTLGIPLRILLGSEQAELASSQDTQRWKETIRDRREQFCLPLIVKPLIRRLIEVGALPSPADLKIYWGAEVDYPPMQQADINLKRIQALDTYTKNPSSSEILPPDLFLEWYMGMTQDEVKVVAEHRLMAENIELAGGIDDIVEDTSTMDSTA